MNSKYSHIYWFAPYDLTCPSTRYRGKIPLDYAQEKYKITYDFVLPDRSKKGLFLFLKVFLKILFFRKKNSLIVIQKICSNRYYAKALKFLISIRTQNTLYDIDDAEYYRQKTETLHFFLKKCQYVQVGSKALQTYCFSFNKNVKIATSPVYEHSQQKKHKNTKLHIGWLGDLGDGNAISKSFSHKTNLFTIFFPEIIKIKYPIKLSIIGVKNPKDILDLKQYFDDYKQIELVVPTDLDWKNDAWVYAKVAEFDVGISPMVNHPFNQAKSAFKAKQYLSCGVPTIASDIGENKNFVLHQKNGIICVDSVDFLKAIHLFENMESSEYQQYMKNALANLDSFSMASYCQILIEK